MRAVRFKDGAVIKNGVHRTRVIIRAGASWCHLGNELLVSAAEEHKRIRADLRRNVIDSRIHINARVKCHRALAQLPSETEFQCTHHIHQAIFNAVTFSLKGREFFKLIIRPIRVIIPRIAVLILQTGSFLLI